MPRGPYAGLAGVELWDEARDARLYDGPWPVVAHPPCSAWCRLAGLVEARWGKKRGEDGDCFDAQCCQKMGGVLEHPAWSDAWPAFRLRRPPRAGGWVRAGLDDPGWTCCVEQAAYGHRARKATWLYAVGVELPNLQWGRAEATAWCTPGTSEQASRGKDTTPMNKRERQATPPAFRDLLLGIARSAKPCSAVAVKLDSKDGSREHFLPNVSSENPGKTAGKWAPPGRFEHPAVDLEGRSHDEEAQRFQ